MSKCANCGFNPISDEDKAKSLILSLDHEIDNEYCGKTKEELKAIATGLRSGNSYEFDPLEIQAVVDHARSVVAIPPRKLIIDGLRWLLPPIALLIIALVFFHGTIESVSDPA
ncbi:hypothetical protein FACS1894154_09370 [Betaproteobacteria bacterium]|nr:hypothetical protein FACS1894154_09370 [Betaproteobacteria bacterium]GHU25275.1 hypothetical protein FACS189488_11890 [Betaproteobacteria bacterium]